MSATSLADDVVPDWAAIAVIILGITAFAVAQGLTYPLIALLLHRRGVPDSLVGLNAASFAGGLAVATLVLGRLTAVLRGDWLIIAGLAGVSLCLATLARFDALWVWFAARFALGFFASLTFMLTEAWLNTACPDRLRGRVTGLYGAGMCAGFAAGPLAIPLLGTDSSFAFALSAVYVALVAFTIAVVSRRTRTRPRQAPMGALLGFVRGAPVLVGMVAAFGFADITAISAMPVYLVRIGETDAFAAVSVTVMALPTAVAQPLVGLLLDRVSRPRIAVACSLTAALAFLSIPVLHTQPAILAAFALMGASTFALYTCALTMLGSAFTGGLLVAGSAAFSLAYAIGSAIGSTATGLAMQTLFPAAGPMLAGAVLLGFTGWFVVRRGSG